MWKCENPDRHYSKKFSNNNYVSLPKEFLDIIPHEYDSCLNNFVKTRPTLVGQGITHYNFSKNHDPDPKMINHTKNCREASTILDSTSCVNFANDFEKKRE